MNKQREVIYDLRRSVLESDDMSKILIVDDDRRYAVNEYCYDHLFAGGEEMVFDTEGLDNYLKAYLSL